MHLNFTTIAFRAGDYLEKVTHAPQFQDQKTEIWRKGSALFKVSMTSFSPFHVFVLFTPFIIYLSTRYVPASLKEQINGLFLLGSKRQGHFLKRDRTWE